MVANNGATLNGNKISTREVQYIQLDGLVTPYQIVVGTEDKVVVDYSELYSNATIVLPPVAPNIGVFIYVSYQNDNDSFYVQGYSGETNVISDRQNLYSSVDLSIINGGAGSVTFVSNGTNWIMLL